MKKIPLPLLLSFNGGYVDTVGFLPGSLAGNLPHSGKLHVVERFTLNPATLELTRGIVAEDPLY